MNHAITYGGLLCGIAIFFGLIIGAFGCLAFMAGGMSDAPSAGETAGRTGCICMVIGIVSIVAAGFWLAA